MKIANQEGFSPHLISTLHTSFSRLAESAKRLSSGLRINSADDDASGLAVRELMRADIAAMNQGVRNAMDAISMLQTVDGALSIIDEKLIRMKELAEQAATGTYNSVQRLMIASEYAEMGSEIERIARATDFNGIKLLTESTTKKSDSTTETNRISGSKQWQEYHFGPTNIINPASNSYSASVIEGYTYLQNLPDDFEGTITISMLNNDSSFIGDSGKILTYQNYTSQNEHNFIVPDQLVETDYSGRYELTFHTDDATGQGYGANKWYISNSGYEYIVRHDQSEDSAKKWWFHQDQGTTLSLLEEKEDGTGLARVNFEPIVIDPETNTVYNYSNESGDPFGLDGQSASIQMTDYFLDPEYTFTVSGGFTDSYTVTGNYDYLTNTFTFNYDLGNNVTIEQSFVINGYPDSHTLTYFSRTLNIDIVHVDGDLSYGYDSDTDVLTGNWNTLAVDVTTYDPTYTIAVEDENGNEVGNWSATLSGGVWSSHSAGFQVEANGDFRIDGLGLDASKTYYLTASIDQDGHEITRSDRLILGPGEIVLEQESEELEEQETVQPVVIHFGPLNNADEDYYAIDKNEVSLKALGLDTSNIATQSGSQKALKQLNSAIVAKDTIRAYYGAMQNRLENTIAAEQIMSENLQVSESRISDADISQEMSEFIRNQIVTQSATAMLAQANSIPKIVLQLIE